VNPPQPPLRYRISHIVRIGSQEEVSGIHAQAVIALMTDEHSLRDLPKAKKPCHPMGGHGLALKDKGTIAF